MPYWLASGDRSYMGIPIEVREPFLDYRVVEFAFTLPLEYLVRDGWQKWIVRKAVEPYLSSDVVWRKRKMGFPFPTRAFLNQNSSIIGSIVRSSSYPGIKKRSQKEWGSRWNLVSFLLWYEWFISRNQPLFDSLKELAPKKAAWPWVPEYLREGSDKGTRLRTCKDFKFSKSNTGGTV
jgi:asparagine synthase (glutamine-hydrolysing)